MIAIIIFLNFPSQGRTSAVARPYRSHGHRGTCPNPSHGTRRMAGNMANDPVTLPAYMALAKQLIAED